MSVNAALVRLTYPSHMLGRAIGINALVVATSAAVGPTLGSGVLAIADWRWLFFINVPLGIVTATIAGFALPYTERHVRPLNHAGVVLYVATCVLLIAVLKPLAHEEAKLAAILQVVVACVF